MHNDHVLSRKWLWPASNYNHCM